MGHCQERKLPFVHEPSTSEEIIFESKKIKTQIPVHKMNKDLALKVKIELYTKQ